MVLNYKNEDELRSYLVCSYLGKNYGLFKSPDPLMLLTKECYEKYIFYVFKNQEDMPLELFDQLIEETFNKIKALFEDKELSKTIKNLAMTFLNDLILQYNIKDYILISPKIQISTTYLNVSFSFNVSACFMKRDIKERHVHYVSFFPLLSRYDPLSDIPTLAKLIKLNDLNYRKNTKIFLDLYDADLPSILKRNVYFKKVSLTKRSMNIEDIKEKHINNATLILNNTNNEIRKIPMCQNFYCPIRKECQNE
jgi:hypothetical protein